VNERGQYGDAGSRGGRGTRAIVGLKLIHTPGDSDRAVRQIDTEMNAIVDAMYRAMDVDPTSLRKPFTLDQAAKMSTEDRATALNPWKDRVLAAKATAMQSPLWAFFDSAVSPAYDDWMKFLWDHEFYSVFTSWEEYEKWLERARQLRATVTGRGVRIETPEPTDLTRSLGADIEAGIGDVWKFAKYAAYGLLGIGAVVALTSVAQNLRSGKDPGEKYMDLLRARASRAPLAPRALPRREQLALPPGDPGLEDE